MRTSSKFIAVVDGEMNHFATQAEFETFCADQKTQRNLFPVEKGKLFGAPVFELRDIAEMFGGQQNATC